MQQLVQLTLECLPKTRSSMKSVVRLAAVVRLSVCGAAECWVDTAVAQRSAAVVGFR